MMEYEICAGGLYRPVARKSYGEDMEFSRCSGFITSIGGTPTTEAKFERSATLIADRRVGGYATRWNKPHPYNGGIDVFMPGAFTHSLAAKNMVRFTEDHDDNLTFATTNGGGLELRSDEVGLAFLADLSEAKGSRAFDLVKSHRKCAMSVKYHVISATIETIAGEQVRLIKSANLEDVSICAKGAVKEAYAQVIEHKGSEPTHADEFFADVNGAYANLMHANRKLKDFVSK